MNPVVKYSFARLGMFGVVLLILMPFPIDVFVKLMAALLISLVLSFFLFKRLRLEMTEQVATGVQRRREQKERLRAALSGDDEPSAGAEPAARGVPTPGPADEPPAR